MAAPRMSAPSMARSSPPAAQASRERAESVAMPALLCAGAALAAGWALLQLTKRQAGGERTAGLLDLPEDVTEAILQRVSAREWSALGATCRHLREAVFQHRCSQRHLHLGVTGPAALAHFARHARTHSLEFVLAFGSPLSHSQAACLASIPSLECLALQGQLGLDIQALAPLSNLKGLFIADVARMWHGSGVQAPIKHLAAQYPSLAAELSDVLPPLEYPAEALTATSAAGAWVPVWGPPQGLSLASIPSSLVFPNLVILSLGGIVYLPKGALPALEELHLQRFCSLRALGLHLLGVTPWQAGPSTRDMSGLGPVLQALEYQLFVEGLFASIGHPIKWFMLDDLPLTLASQDCICKGVSEGINLTTYANLCVLGASSTLADLKLCICGPISADPACSLWLPSFPALQRLELDVTFPDISVCVLPALTSLVLCQRAVSVLVNPRQEQQFPTLRQVVLQNADLMPSTSEAEPLQWVYRRLQALPFMESLRLVRIGGQEQFLRTFLHRGQPARLDVRPGKPDSVLWTSALP